MVKMTYTAFSDEDIIAMQPAMKIGLLATVNPQGLPHLTLITTLMACAPNQLSWGQFTEGLSKQFILQNPRTGFLVMSLDKQLWYGKANFTHTARQGKEYDFYNNTPMFRYNAYFGVHTVYYMDLVAHSGRQALPMGKVIWAAMLTMLARALGKKDGREQVMNGWTQRLLNKMDNLKFLAYVDEDGYPVILPVIQAQCLNAHQVIFSTAAYRKELESIPSGCSMALFGMSLTMEDVLVRGTYLGLRRRAGVQIGSLAVDWVYNAMPPVPGQVYPPLPLEAVRQF